MDIDEFMTSYFSRIERFAESKGLDAERFMKALKSGTKAMASNDGRASNHDAFWQAFFELYPESEDVAEAIADEFYVSDFDRVGDNVVKNPSAQRSIEILANKGYPLVLTTMPMFPTNAVRTRLGWAGVDPDAFERITSYENSRFVKPMQTYYAENLAAMGIEGADVLMVGNNTMEDLSFMDLGVDAFLITDWLLDPIDLDISQVKHGSFEDFEKWVASLPDCEDPAVDISNGMVALEDMERSLKRNANDDLDLTLAVENAKKVADAVTGEGEMRPSKMRGIRNS